MLEHGRTVFAANLGSDRRSSQTDMLDEIDQQCSDLRYQASERIVDVEASILALRGLQDAVSEMRSNVDALNERMRESEQEPISSDLPGVRAQLDIVKVRIIGVGCFV